MYGLVHMVKEVDGFGRPNGSTVRMTWSDWAQNRLNNKYDHKACVQMWREQEYRWDDSACHTKQRFVCVKPLKDLQSSKRSVISRVFT